MGNSYEETSVSVNKSKEQIEKLLKKFNVRAIRFTSYPSYALLEFAREVSKERIIPYRITVKPKVKGYSRNPTTELDRAERQVWRVVYWWLKSKLEAVDFGLVEFEQDFLPYMMLATPGGGDTVDHIFFQRLAGHTALPDSPFEGLQPKALPPGEARGDETPCPA